MTMNWTDGYVSDIEYIPGFYYEQTPSHINAVCYVNGFELPVQPGEAFGYCELGCGRGETSLMIAAANPHADVWAFDFNPSHIAEARRMAKNGGLSNVHFGEESFKQLAEGKLPANMPMFNYITLHGVWSWINNENRAYIIRFLDRYLKPGGVVYVSYNALPGWSNIIPLRKLLFLLAEDEIGKSDQRALGAVEKLRALVSDNARFLPKDFVEKISKSGSYLSHEYLNEDWDPTFHVDVASDLAAAKLSYFGTANILENFGEFSFTPSQNDKLVKASPGSVETLKDYFLDRTFRRDLFIKGPQRLPDRRAIQRIEECVIELCISSENVNFDINIPLGQANLNRDLYEPIFAALKTGPKRIGDLMKLPGVPETNPNARQILGVLIGSQQVKLTMPDADRQPSANILRFNQAYINACSQQARTNATLACANTGQAIPLSLFEMLAYEAIMQGAETTLDTLTSHIADILEERQDKLIHDNRTIETRSETITFLKPHIEKVIKVYIPLWKALGAL